MPDSSTIAAAVAAVERAMAELRRGGIVVLRDSQGHVALVAAAESISGATFERLQALGREAPVLITTRRRAEAVGIDIPPHIAGGLGDANGPITLELPGGVPPDIILKPNEPENGGHAARRHLSRPVASHAPKIARAAIELAKLARLLPAVVIGPLPRDAQGKRRAWAVEQDLMYVAAGDVLDYEEHSARELRAVAERACRWRTPRTRASSPGVPRRRQGASRHRHRRDRSDGAGADPPAFGVLHRRPAGQPALRLRRAAARRHRRDRPPGSGVLLYLAQEGRGIGLVNKLRAYQLQDAGFDTVDANEQLGFDADERVYRPAATMLARMGIKRVRLMTNNPLKIGQLSQYGIEVAERVPHIFPANGHNEKYLRTKAEKSGHLF